MTKCETEVQLFSPPPPGHKHLHTLTQNGRGDRNTGGPSIELPTTQGDPDNGVLRSQVLSNFQRLGYRPDLTGALTIRLPHEWLERMAAMGMDVELSGTLDGWSYERNGSPKRTQDRAPCLTFRWHPQFDSAKRTRLSRNDTLRTSIAKILLTQKPKRPRGLTEEPGMWELVWTLRDLRSRGLRRLGFTSQEIHDELRAMVVDGLVRLLASWRADMVRIVRLPNLRGELL